MIVRANERQVTVRAVSNASALVARGESAARQQSRSVSDTVTLSPDARERAAARRAWAAVDGKAMLLQRLFHTDDPSAEPRVERSVTVNASGSVYPYLDRGDRAMLAKAYEYAQENGIDPEAVDHLAFDLSAYRMKVPSGGSPDTTGTFREPQTGRVLVNEFSPEDEAGAREILSLKAMKDTQIDHDFLSAVLHPGRTPAHAVSFDFLKEVVVALSPQHSDGAIDSSVSFADRDARQAFAQAARDAPATPDVQGAGTRRDGKAIMMSRLFGAGQDASVVSAAKRPRFAEYLSNDDKTLLEDLYGSAEANGADLNGVDKLAEALGALRRSEAALEDSGVLSLLAPLDAAPPPHHNALDHGKLQDRR